MAEGNSYRDNLKFDMKNTTVVTIDLIKDVLVAKADYSYLFNHSRQNDVISQVTYSNGPGIQISYPASSSMRTTETQIEYHSGNANLSFTPRLPEDHSLNVMAGWNIEHKRARNTRMGRDGFIVDGKPNYSLMNGIDYVLEDANSYDWGFVGIFYRASYAYKGKYLAELSGRYDGNSKFPSNQRWGFFPSFSLGWRVSEEAFFDGIRDQFNNLKLRFSYGQLGNQNVGYYDYIRKISIGSQNYLFGGDKPTTATISAPVASDLSWERSIHKNLGVDMSFLNNRLAFSADFYIRDTKDMLTAGIALPATYGADSPKMNSADLRTKGYELSLNWRDEFQLLRRPFSYSVTLTFNDYVSNITKFDNPDRSFAKKYYEGMRWGEIWGYRIDGLFASDEEARNYPVDQTTVNEIINASAGAEKGLRAGDLKFRDVTGDGKITEADRTMIGNPTPDFTYGYSVNLQYKNFDLGIDFQGVYGNELFNTSFLSAYAQYNYHTKRLGRWNGEGTSNWEPILDSSRATQMMNSSYFIEDGSYLRLKNIQLGYSFGDRILKKIRLKALRVFMNIDNLATWSHNTGYTPEIGGTALAFGIDTGDTYPMPTTITFGVNVSF